MGAEYLAARGYTTLSILSRHASGPERSHVGTPFEKASRDIAAAIDWLDGLGAPKIILAGHSLGSIRITKYMTDTEDSRVDAMVHFAPTRNMPDWMRAGMGQEKYAAFMNNAARLVSEGRGDTFLYETYEMPPPAPSGIEVGNMHTAEIWLNWWGPAAQTRQTDWLSKINIPIMLLSGDADGFVSKAWMDEVEAAARVGSPSVTVKWYEGGVNHVFDGHREITSKDVLEWLIGQGLEARPFVRTRLADMIADDGRKLSGIAYEPANGEASGPPGYMVMYGYSGDIMWSSSHWMCVRLAQFGRRCVAGQTRGASQQIYRQTLEAEMPDFGGCVDWLEREGHEQIVLVGHSWGGIRITRYAVSSEDDRVAGFFTWRRPVMRLRT